MKIFIIKRRGLFKYFRATVELGYVPSDDMEDLYNKIVKMFKEWDNK